MQEKKGQLTFTCSKSTTETLEKSEICSKLTIKTPEGRQWRSGVFINVVLCNDFEQVNVSWEAIY